MEPKGHVLCKKEFTATKLWPDPQISMNPPYLINLEEEYKKALAGELVTVMDISTTDGKNDGYLVLGESKEVGPFLWMIEADDTREGSFIPVIKKYGTIMPAGLSLMEQLIIVASNDTRKTAQYKNFHKFYYTKYRKP
jgi:hypothetical protein